jgi:hypothetical protein
MNSPAINNRHKLIQTTVVPFPNRKICSISALSTYCLDGRSIVGGRGHDGLLSPERLERSVSRVWGSQMIRK